MPKNLYNRMLAKTERNRLRRKAKALHMRKHPKYYNVVDLLAQP